LVDGEEVPEIPTGPVMDAIGDVTMGIFLNGEIIGGSGISATINRRNDQGDHGSSVTASAIFKTPNVATDSTLTIKFGQTVSTFLYGPILNIITLS